MIGPGGTLADAPDVLRGAVDVSAEVCPRGLLTAHRVRTLAPLQQPAGDDRTLYLARALPDAVYPELSVVPLGRVLGHVSAATEDLDRPVSDPAVQIFRSEEHTSELQSP